jgi:hypothetical protein
MIKLTFLSCLDENFNKTRTWKLQSTVECTNLDEARKAIDHEFSMHSREGWKVEFELIGDLGATYSNGRDCSPLTVHKIDKTGKKLWASYDRYEVNGGQWPNVTYRYWNENANDESQWIEFHLRSNGRYIQKGYSIKERPLMVDFRSRYEDPHF